MILDDYASYSLSVILKDNGFNEFCQYFYEYNKPYTGYLENKKYGKILNSRNYEDRELCACPTHQVVKKWLLLCKNLEVNVFISEIGTGVYGYTYSIDIVHRDNNGLKVTPIGQFLPNNPEDCSYYDAMEDAFKYCITEILPNINNYEENNV